MKKSLFIILLLLPACSSVQTTKGRRLTEEERLRHGLTGIAYDLPFCPTSYDENTKTSKVTGPCELVTCEMEDKVLVCRAKRPVPASRI